MKYQIQLNHKLVAIKLCDGFLTFKLNKYEFKLKRLKVAFSIVKIINPYSNATEFQLYVFVRELHVGCDGILESITTNGGSGAVAERDASVSLCMSEKDSFS